MKVSVAGLGFVGLSQALLLARQHSVCGYDTDSEHIHKLRIGKTDLADRTIGRAMENYGKNVEFSFDFDAVFESCEIAILALPTDFDEAIGSLDTQPLEDIAARILRLAPNCTIVVKSTVPVGFCDQLEQKTGSERIVFCPEFLREGSAIDDNSCPDRIVVGGPIKFAQVVQDLYADAALNKDVPLHLLSRKEAEAVKLFSNAYLAMRVAFFNELDGFALSQNLRTKAVIDAVCDDHRIDNHYNNPSFGFGGYCLPKDVRQLASQFGEAPHPLVDNILISNEHRARLMFEAIVESNAKCVGFFRVGMKAGSHNTRSSSTIRLMDALMDHQIKVVVCDPLFSTAHSKNIHIENCLDKFASMTDLIVCNRYEAALDPYKEKVFTRDVFGIG